MCGVRAALARRRRRQSFFALAEAGEQAVVVARARAYDAAVEAAVPLAELAALDVAAAGAAAAAEVRRGCVVSCNAL